MSYLKSLKWEMVVFSGVCILVGCVMAFMPGATTVILGTLCAALLFIYAIRHFIEYGRRYNTGEIFKYELVMGIVFTLLAIFVLIKMDSILSIISYIIAAVILISALMKIENALDLKRMGAHWVPMLFVAIILLIVSIVIFMAPMNKGDDGRNTAGNVVLIGTGIALIFTGVVNLISTLVISGKIKNWTMEQNSDNLEGDIIDVEYEEVDDK